MRKLIFVGTLLLSSVPFLPAAVLLSDSFNYPNGSLVPGNPPWVHHSGTTTGEVQVAAGRIALKQTDSEDVSALLPGQPYPSSTNILLYASFTVNFSALPAGSSDYFAHFKAAATSGFADKIFATTNGAPAGFFRLGLANTANSPNVIVSSNLSLNTDYQVVTRYAPSNATSTLWITPAAENSASVTATDAGTTITVATYAFRQTSGIGNLFLDNLVVGTSFNEVVAVAPAITTQPQSQTVNEGSNATFIVVASGSGSLSYQWQFNDASQVNATNSTFTLTNVVPAQGGDYSVIVSNSAGVTNSQVATLTVNPTLPTAPSISAQPQSQTVTEGSSVSFTVTAVGTQPLSYQWQFNGADLAGATMSSLALAVVTTNDAGSYTVTVTNSVGVTNSQAAVLTVDPAPEAPTITAEPQGQIVNEGDTVTFGVSASGTEPFAYQWRHDGTNLPAATNSILTLIAVTSSQAGTYTVLVSNVAGSTNSQPALLAVNTAAQPLPALSYLTYNVKGNFATNWTTNAPQIQAIGHELMYLNPDIIAFNEIPNQYTYQMTNFVAAFLPGYFLATNSATDGFIRSVVASRFPITFSASHLHSANLDPYGYTNANFTRDLFEAQIAVPNFPQPLHVFTVHLKSGQGTDDSARRGAESRAISNYLVTVFQPANPNHPYLLSGDMNEDIYDPPSSHPQSIQHMVNPATGLQLVTPVNPFSGSYLTFSIQNTNGLNKRYDYIMPCGVLFSNIASSQVFRTDLLTNPPPPLMTNDDSTASDHLPVLMMFANPYDKPFRLTSFSRSNLVVTLSWNSVAGQPYRVEASSNLAAWTVFANNLTATSNSVTFSTNSVEALNFFRVYRIP